MAELVAAAGLASSIITFIDFSCQFGTRLNELRKLVKELPADLQTCERLVKILGKSLRRLQSQYAPTTSPTSPGGMEEDLELLVEGCTETIGDFIEILDNLKAKSSRKHEFRRALKIVRAEGKILGFERSLDQYLIDILVVLGESHEAAIERIRKFSPPYAWY